MSKIECQANLWYCEGTSDKVYNATVQEEGNGYVVNFAYGRRGSALKTGSKTSSPVSLTEAIKVFDRLIIEKTSKGYQFAKTTAANKAIPVVQAATPSQNKPEVQCVLLNSIDEVGYAGTSGRALAVQLTDDDWYAQPKLDGVRFLLKKQGNHILGYNRKGIQVPVPVEIHESVQASDAYYDGGCANFLIDGELIGNIYHVFDVLEHDDGSVRDYSFENRTTILKTLFEDIGSDHIKFVDVAIGPKQKLDLYNYLVKNNKEGIVFKYRFAKYVPGRPNSGGYYLKQKFYSTASCIVAEVNAKRSVRLNVIEGKYPVAIGNCTIPANHDIPEVGSIVEIKYLYAYKNGSLYQPIYLGERTDLDGSDCLIDQLKFKSEVD